MFAKLRVVLTITILFLSFCGSAQTSYWKRASPAAERAGNAVIGRQMRFSLSPEKFAVVLPSGSQYASGDRILYFPDTQGKLIPFAVKGAPVLSEALAARYPGIQSFVGRAVGDADLRIRFSLSHKGIQSMMVHADGKQTTFMERAAGESDQYLVYQREAVTGNEDGFICHTRAALQKGGGPGTLKLVDDQQLRKFRIAVSASGEYTQYHGGTVTDALAAINATLTRVNEVFETDLGIRLELIPETDQVIFTDPASDPYGANFNMEVQNTLSTVIGEAGYDVGHLFLHDTNNGNAGFIGSVCRDNQKGSAYSAALDPQGDIFDLDFVAHELGHQFGANHTWSFESEGTLVQVEPGSGSTIMGYAGIVQGNNVAPNGDDYFHYFSIFQIRELLETIGCGEVMAINNSPPEIIPAGNYIIPKSTAFVLRGMATDPDPLDILTYAWEQIDNGVVNAETFGPDNPSGANFRSRKPSVSAERFFPMLSEVIQGNLTQTNPTVNSAWETVSDVEREFNFALTVRDNSAEGGQVASELVNIMVLNNTGPFTVTSQQTAQNYAAGSVQTVNWDVANTDKNPVNAQLVDIYLSQDGGLSYPIQLADATLNDGSHDVLLPGITAAQARFMVKADNNVFFAVNAADFSIAEADVVLNFESLEAGLCKPDDLVIPFLYETGNGFDEEVTFSTSGLPAGLAAGFSPATALADNTPVNLSLTNTTAVTPGNYEITVTASGPGISVSVDLQLNVYEGVFTAVNLNAPADGSQDTTLTALLQWDGDEDYTAYEVQIATDNGFNNLVDSALVGLNAYRPLPLEEATVYFWRVKPENNCGEGTFGPADSFSTIALNCKATQATDLPTDIPSMGTPTISSRINFVNDLPVADVNLRLALDHTFLADLIISLTSPSGTKVTIVSNSCGEFQNIDAVFDDEAGSFICGTNPGIGGTVKPLGSLASFDGESIFGEWVLEVFDTAPADGGILIDFALEICVEGDFRPDVDKDGVFDDGDDLCPGTAPGTEVDVQGCPVFRFDTSNFSVAIHSETCIANDNGAIEITAGEVLNYMIAVTGNGLDVSDSFSTGYLLENLRSGTYTVCITATAGQDGYQPFCFDAVVTEPEPLGVIAEVSETGLSAMLQLTGSDLYTIELNGIITEIEASEIALDLKEGSNLLKVSTQLPCQGVYSREIFISAHPVVYPNPFRDRLTVRFNDGQSRAGIFIYSADGRLLRRGEYESHGGEIEVDSEGLPPGIYYLRIRAAATDRVYKVIKR